MFRANIIYKFLIMKNKKLSLTKLNLKKMTISSLQSVKGGYVRIADSGDNCDSADRHCNSMNTALTDYAECCG